MSRATHPPRRRRQPRHERSVGPADYGFINLRTRSIIDRFSDATVSIAWLPNGRCRQLGTDGHPATGTPAGARNPTGSFNPQGRSLDGILVTTQGTQFMARLTDTSTALTKSDLRVPLRGLCGLRRAAQHGVTLGSHLGCATDRSRKDIETLGTITGRQHRLNSVQFIPSVAAGLQSELEAVRSDSSGRSVGVD